ncbi:hypothetical protein [Vulcanisaeta sp. JCM 16159]|uniref:hypothetical protein n=1 Tax=Vulcanisaeta sp. JCM 16159 TaxID=1295371 RepID=UPI0006D28063|nr:hypothetical protein [Vulcanisaeta sp. JCM 16159]
MTKLFAGTDKAYRQLEGLLNERGISLADPFLQLSRRDIDALSEVLISAYVPQPRREAVIRPNDNALHSENIAYIAMLQAAAYAAILNKKPMVTLYISPRHMYLPILALRVPVPGELIDVVRRKLEDAVSVIKRLRAGEVSDVSGIKTLLCSECDYR